jgi:hypothetical protein
MMGLKFSCWVRDGENSYIQAGIDVPGMAHKPILSVIAQLCNARVLSLGKVTFGERCFLGIADENFRSALLWVVYKQLKTINRKDFLDCFPPCKAHESRGLLYNSLLELAHECLDFVHKFESAESLPYSSGLDWWWLCMCESLTMFVYEGSARTTKKKLLDGMASDLDDLQNYRGINNREREDYPHVTTLLETAMRIAQHNPKESKDLRKARRRFRNGCWKNYLEAYKELRLTFAKPYVRSPYLKNGDVYYEPSIRRQGVPKEVCLTHKSEMKGFKSGRGRKLKSK